MEWKAKPYFNENSYFKRCGKLNFLKMRCLVFFKSVNETKTNIKSFILRVAVCIVWYVSSPEIPDTGIIFTPASREY